MLKNAPDSGHEAAGAHAERTSLAALEVLVATHSHGSISAAARALGVTQPTASATLRRLERRLGIDLVVRAARGSVLTETGRAAATWASDVLDASDRFESSVLALVDRPAVRVRIAASMTIAEHLAPRWLAARAIAVETMPEPPPTRGRAKSAPAPQAAAKSSRDRPPAPDVELIVRNSQDVMTMVLEGAVEIGFIESPNVDRGLRSQTFATDELVVVVAPDHAWRRRRAVSVTELLGGGLVVREPGSGTRETLERALAGAGAELPEHVPYLGSTAAVTTAVRYEGAAAVVSRLAVADDVSRGILHALRVPDLALVRPLRLVWKDGAELSGPARQVAAQALRSARQQTAV